MPIDSINSIVSPVSAILQPRAGRTQEIPEIDMQKMEGFGREMGAESLAPSGPTFGQALQNAIGEVNRAQLHAGDLSTRFAAGENIDVHQVMIASQEASVALNLAIQVRNKVVDGYQELMRVSV